MVQLPKVPCLEPCTVSTHAIQKLRTSSSSRKISLVPTSDKHSFCIRYIMVWCKFSEDTFSLATWCEFKRRRRRICIEPSIREPRFFALAISKSFIPVALWAMLFQKKKWSLCLFFHLTIDLVVNWYRWGFNPNYHGNHHNGIRKIPKKKKRFPACHGSPLGDELQKWQNSRDTQSDSPWRKSLSPSYASSRLPTI